MLLGFNEHLMYLSFGGPTIITALKILTLALVPKGQRHSGLKAVDWMGLDTWAVTAWMKLLDA